jgi:uncharacterized protein (UPF0276 family)
MMNTTGFPVIGAGLGLRRGLLRDLQDVTTSEIDFLELAPENWIGVGGRFGRQFERFAERFPILCHGLSLSIGSPAELDIDFLESIKTFLDRYGVRCYSEHLSYCSDSGHLYDLMPIPFTEEAVRYVAGRVRRVQEVLERRMVLEHISAYAAQAGEMNELEFLCAVLEEADCDLLIDVNNVFVNSVNFDFDPCDYIRGLPSRRIAYGHIAGHFVEAEDLRIDTHGSAIIDEVWDLLDLAYEVHGVFPTLLERDFNFPGTAALLAEIERIKSAQKRAQVAGETAMHAAANPLPQRCASVYLGPEREAVQTR